MGNVSYGLGAIIVKLDSSTRVCNRLHVFPQAAKKFRPICLSTLSATGIEM